MQQIPSTAGVQRVVQIIVPRGNDRDVLAAETFFAALRNDEPVALELAARGDKRALQLRGSPDAVRRAAALLRNAWPQAECADVQDEADLAFTIAPIRRAVELRLRDRPYLPIRTYISRDGRLSLDDFRQAGDPVIGVLAAMDDLHEGEACMVQFVLRPVPDDWGKYWRGATNDVGERAKVTPQAMSILLMAVMGGLGIAIGLMWLLLALIQGGNGTLTAAGLAAIVAGAGALFARFRVASPPDPALVKQKINAPAFRVWARVFVAADSAIVAADRLRRVIGAFNAYNLAGGNGFRATPLPGDVLPQSFDQAADPFLARLPLVGLARPPWRALPILNTAELAMLWHLPHAASGYQGFAQAPSKRLAPQPEHVADGVWIGQSNVGGRLMDVRLPRAQLNGNIGLIAKTQSGKSNLMAIITSDIIANEPETAVIVIDPHRDLARLVTANLPEHRRGRAIYWSLADIDRPFGLNLLERPFNRRAGDLLLRPERIVDNIIVAFREIWRDNWGPRMEDYLRWPLLTLCTANEMLVADVAFARWLNEARAVFKNAEIQRAGEPEFVPSRISQVNLDMIERLCGSFGMLMRPRRPTAEETYDEVRKLVDLHQALLARVRQGETHVTPLLLANLARMHQALFADVVRGRRADTGASARVYGTEKRPMQYSLLDVQPMQVSSSFRLDVLRSLPQDTHWRIHRWWQEYETYAAAHLKQLIEMITPVRTKLRQFDASDVAARIFGQPESTIDLARLIDEGGVLAVDLAAGVVGQDVAALIGSTLLNTVASLLFAQAGADRANRRKVLIVVDEFQSIPGADYAAMLGELAKYGARMMLGTQSLGVLAEMNRALRSAWLDNTNTLFVFRCGGEDARAMADELSISAPDPLTVQPGDIVGLPDHACFVRMRDARGAVQVFRAETRKMDEGSADAFEAVRERSRQMHGRDAREVDAILAEAHRYHGPATAFGGTSVARTPQRDAQPVPVVTDDVPAGDEPVPLPGSRARKRTP